MIRKFLEFILWLFGYKMWDPAKAGGGRKPGKEGDYVNYANDYIIPLPGIAKDTLMYCFPLEANYEKLQAICDERLNFGLEGKPLRYFPLTHHVVLVMSNIAEGISLDTSYKKYGSVNETATQVFMPIVECKLNSKDEWVAERIVIGVPYIFIDNPFSMAIGREELGFPKGLGKFDFWLNPDEAKDFNTEVFGFQKFDKENPQQAAWFQFLKATRGGDSGESGSWGSGKEAWENVKDTFERVPKTPPIDYGLPFVIHELEDLAGGYLPMIFLKQFRDSEFLNKACYQAIIEGSGQVKDFKGGWFMGSEYELEFSDFASFPICENMGIPKTVTVKAPFWIKADLEFAQGKVVWQA